MLYNFLICSFEVQDESAGFRVGRSDCKDSGARCLWAHAVNIGNAAPLGRATRTRGGDCSPSVRAPGLRACAIVGSHCQPSRCMLALLLARDRIVEDALLPTI